MTVSTAARRQALGFAEGCMRARPYPSIERFATTESA
jgi:hypothetical protein